MDQVYYGSLQFFCFYLLFSARCLIRAFSSNLSLKITTWFFSRNFCHRLFAMITILSRPKKIRNSGAVETLRQCAGTRETFGDLIKDDSVSNIFLGELC